jgi:hypothetical protein
MEYSKETADAIAKRGKELIVDGMIHLNEIIPVNKDCEKIYNKISKVIGIDIGSSPKEFVDKLMNTTYPACPIEVAHRIIRNKACEHMDAKLYEYLKDMEQNTQEK